MDVWLSRVALVRTDKVDIIQRRCLATSDTLQINIALAILCSERLSRRRKMNTGPNPEMTELAMMTNVPAGRTAGRVIPHCHQDGLSHMTKHGSLPQRCFSGYFFFFFFKLLFTISILLWICTQIRSYVLFIFPNRHASSRSFSMEY